MFFCVNSLTEQGGAAQTLQPVFRSSFTHTLTHSFNLWKVWNRQSQFCSLSALFLQQELRLSFHGNNCPWPHTKPCSPHTHEHVACPQDAHCSHGRRCSGGPGSHGDKASRVPWERAAAWPCSPQPLESILRLKEKREITLKTKNKPLRVKRAVGDGRVCVCVLTFGVRLWEVDEGTAVGSRGLDEVTSEDGNSSDKLFGGGVLLQAGISLDDKSKHT